MPNNIENEVERVKEKIKRYHLQAEQHHTTVLKTRRHYRASMNDLLKIFEQTITTLQSHHEEEVKKAVDAERKAIVQEIQKIADTTPPNLLLNEIVNKITPITNNQA